MKDLKADKYIPYEVMSRALIQFINEDWLILGDIHQVESDEELGKCIKAAIELYHAVQRIKKGMLWAQWETFLYNLMEQIFKRKYGLFVPTKRDVSGRLKEYLNIMSRDVLEAEINSLEEDLVCLR
ncbi:hypothetical protein [Ileibacterium valens]|uniref:hypothetical protein n=1 Tax=Ileibacterium valens TaxID=1862668 RepID=UPI00272F502B|nr:hypothetical protein [Ileibacterium valens]